jgi:hypothetical protein
MTATDLGLAGTPPRIEPGVSVVDIVGTWRAWVTRHWLASSLIYNPNPEPGEDRLH